ncbi:InlB B-repeat-containing protein, partial [Candidatus Bathycorpusculum sp.]|uniref:InlB B-repeat-containing protein n=1 Tax=Candidatus Bathycorpusculum sp. TaxID=2994959 RepID=UPI00281843B2|nr:InlB B-repeat-containing protein [Candidatus Termitimicrobium sp.]
MNVKIVFDRRRLHTKQSFIIITLLLTAILLFSPLTLLFNTASPFVSALDADTIPRGVDGRILTAAKAGDTSDWIEIAKYNEYSLIVRKSYINWYDNVADDHSNQPLWQSVAYGSANYAGSPVRTRINAWFSSAASGTYVDNLDDNARLRDYVAGNNALDACGLVASEAAMADGLSYPRSDSTQSSDLAFALSFSEVANFFSRSHDMRVDIGFNPEVQTSTSPAPENFAKMNSLSTDYGMWLRTIGDTLTSSGFLGLYPIEGKYGRAFQVERNSPQLVYPALWVQSDIFEYDITYELNGGGINPSTNPTSYKESDLPLKIADPFGVYEFLGWNVEYANGTAVSLQKQYVIPEGTSSDVKLTAIWSTTAYASYKINYNLDGGTNSPRNPDLYTPYYVSPTNPVTLYSPDKAGYNFKGWTVEFSDGTPNVTEATLSFSIPVGTIGNITLTALWSSPIPYTINYELNGGSIPEGATNPASYTVEDNFPIVIVDPVKPGYNFVGWTVQYVNKPLDIDQKSYSIPAGTTGNLILHAKWVSVDLSADVFHNYKNSGQDSESVVLPSEVYNLADLYKTDKNGQTYNVTKVVVEKIPHSITYEVDTYGTGGSIDYVLIGDEYTIKTCTEADITIPDIWLFEAWYTQKNGEGLRYLPGNTITVTENLTLYARLTPRLLRGALSSEDFIQAPTGSQEFTPVRTGITRSSDDITRTAFVFEGSALANPIYEFEYGYAYEITIEYELQYTVKIVDSYAGSNSGAGNYFEGDTVVINAGIRNGYTFDGWTTDNNAVTFVDYTSETTTFEMPASNVTVTAKWLVRSDLSYVVNYLEQGTDKVVAAQKVVGGQVFGSSVVETAIDV